LVLPIDWERSRSFASAASAFSSDEPRSRVTFLLARALDDIDVDKIRLRDPGPRESSGDEANAEGATKNKMAKTTKREKRRTDPSDQLGWWNDTFVFDLMICRRLRR